MYLRFPIVVTLRLTFLTLWIVAFAGCGGGSHGNSGSSSNPSGGPTPSTTLQAETANNTSASSSLSSPLNGLPSPGNVSKVDSHTLLYNGATTQIYASMVGWFGEPSHMNVGYNSNNPQQVQQQVADMQSRGIQGAILDWYGENGDPFVNSTAQALRAAAEAQSGFVFAIMEDAGALFQYNLPSTVMLYLKATGRPTIQNKMSPAVSFHAGDQPPNLNLAVSQNGTLAITASATAASGSFASSMIDFGDGTSAVNGPTASHSYAQAGVYNITATAIDSAVSSWQSTLVVFCVKPGESAWQVAAINCRCQALSAAVAG